MAWCEAAGHFYVLGMARNKRRASWKLNLTPLMDVFTVLVFFLMFNSSSVETLQQPKQITLPESVTEAKPRETVVIFRDTVREHAHGERRCRGYPPDRPRHKVHMVNAQAARRGHKTIRPIIPFHNML